MSFALFLTLWNKTQNTNTPDLHYRIADWLNECWTRGRKRLAMTVFRGAGKSTLSAIFAAWVLSEDPDLRILVISADQLLAHKMVRNTRKIIEKHPLTAHLMPEKPDQWAADRFTVKRPKELRDPSFLAKGITSNVTGSRADIIICDDVEVPNTCNTADKRKALREKLLEIEFVLTPDGTQLYLGTPHTWFSLYAEDPRTEIGEETIFLDGFQRLKIPVLDKSGQSVWPERFTLEGLNEQKRKSGPNAFASQMMIEPVNISNGRLNPALMRPYSDELEYSEVQVQVRLKLKDRNLVSASAWWDPAFGSAAGDHSVLAIVFTDEEGEHWLHHIAYIRVNENAQEDEATQQCRIITRLAADYYLPSITVETNGIGGFLPSILKRELAIAGVQCSVIEHSSRRNKDDRILEAFDAVLAARALHVHKSVYDTPFITEMQEWRPGKSSGYDDGLDAVAGALSLEPIRIKRHYPNKFVKSWRSDAHTANTDFDV